MIPQDLLRQFNDAKIKLDKEFGPKWIQEISLDKLDMDDPYECIIGQLCGGYANAPTDFHEIGVLKSTAFNLTSYNLGRYWKEYITELRCTNSYFVFPITTNYIVKKSGGYIFSYESRKNLEKLSDKEAGSYYEQLAAFQMWKNKNGTLDKMHFLMEDCDNNHLDTIAEKYVKATIDGDKATIKELAKEPDFVDIISKMCTQTE